MRARAEAGVQAGVEDLEACAEHAFDTLKHNNSRIAMFFGLCCNCQRLPARPSDAGLQQ